MYQIQLQVYDLVVAVGLLAAPINIYAFWILHKYPRVMGSVACVFHKALAIVDLLTALSCISFGLRIIVSRDSAVLSMFTTMSTLSFTSSSALLLDVICLDRFFAIKKPLHHLVHFTPKKAKVYATLVIVGSCVYMMVQSSLTYFGGTRGRFDQSVTDKQALIRQIVFFITAFFVVAIVITLTVMNILLLITVVRATKHQRALRGDTLAKHVSVASRTSMRVARTVLVMTGAFYIAFMPGILCVGLMTAGFNIDISIIHASFVIMQGNCLFNPFIYLVMIPAFRRTALRKFCLSQWNVGESVERESVEINRGPTL